MFHGVSLPQFERFGDAHKLAELAREAEEVGWDGFFIWDHILFDDLWHPMVDPWVALAAIALNTQDIRLGTIVTPLARRRPWKLARETVSIDHLSNGRLILGVGLGDPARWEYGFFGEEMDARIRAQKLDEGLEILTGLWSGEPFAYQGEHYHLKEMVFLPTPIQSPRIPIWVGGYWPNKAPMRRAARWDGFCPINPQTRITPENWREISAYMQAHRADHGPFDAVHFGTTPGDNLGQAADIVAPYAQVGITWWIEDISPHAYGSSRPDPWTPELVERMEQRLRQGPPKSG